jgi:hypothetical protein
VPNPNLLAGIVPQITHPIDDGETAIVEQIAKIEGEVALDTYVKAQTSAPEVVKRITELENCLQRLASLVLTSVNLHAHSELRAVAEEAKLLLKNRLEVDETKHRFHTELGRGEGRIGNNQGLTRGHRPKARDKIAPPFFLQLRACPNTAPLSACKMLQQIAKLHGKFPHYGDTR